MTNTEKIRDDLYIKKGWDGYRVVYPNRIDLSKPLQKGNINWKNFVGQWHFWLKAIIILFLLWKLATTYTSDMKQCSEIVTNIKEICFNYSSSYASWENANRINYSAFNFSNIFKQNGDS